MTKVIVTLQGEKELLLADVIKGASEKLMKEEGILGKAELLNQPELKVFPFMQEEKECVGAVYDGCGNIIHKLMRKGAGHGK